MNLVSISITRLHHIEFGQFIIRLFSDVKGTGIDPKTDPDFFALYQSLQQQSPTYDSALDQVRAQAETDELIEDDLHRDRKVSTVYRAWSVYEYSDDEPEIVAYKNIKLVLHTYEGIEKLNYEAESLAIENFIKQLRNSTNLPFIQTLGMEKHVDNLEASNEKFKKTFDSRSNKTVSTVVYDVKKLRVNLAATYKDLADYTLTMAKTKKTSYYNNLLSSINNGRSYFADILAKRAGTNKGNGGTTTTPTK